MEAPAQLPRIRQVVLAATALEPVVAALQTGLGPGLGEPFHDPAVEYFGLRNAVFALGDTFVEVVSPVREGTAAGRQLERRGGDCGYMVMVQVVDLDAARERATSATVRPVFEVSLDDMAEVHLHPADMRGAIVSMSVPKPVRSWRWGGPGWEERGARAGVAVAGATVAVADPAALAERWDFVLGGLPGISFDPDPSEPGLVEVRLAGVRALAPFTAGGVRFVVESGNSMERVVS